MTQRTSGSACNVLALDPLEHYEASLTRGSSDARAEVAIGRAYRKLVPRWHFEMLNDEERNAAFRAALNAVVKQHQLVLDVGTGTGLLAMMAAQSGARAVVSCETVAPIAHLARRIIAANGLADCISVVPKLSADLHVGQDLPSRADVLVTETVDCGLLGEQILPTIRHAREHLLKDDARIIPASARVYFTLLESVAVHKKNFARVAGGLDVSLFNRFSTREYFPVRASNLDHRRLSLTRPLFTFDFQQSIPASRAVRLPVEVAHSGDVHAILFWFDLELADGIRLSNHPANANSHWMQAVHCFERPLRVERGTTVVLEASHDDGSFQFALHQSNDRTNS
jgi:type II protein arginine methyltransferase